MPKAEARSYRAGLGVCVPPCCGCPRESLAARAETSRTFGWLRRCWVTHRTSIVDRRDRGVLIAACHRRVSAAAVGHLPVVRTFRSAINDGVSVCGICIKLVTTGVGGGRSPRRPRPRELVIGDGLLVDQRVARASWLGRARLPRVQRALNELEVYRSVELRVDSGDGRRVLRDEALRRVEGRLSVLVVDEGAGHGSASGEGDVGLP